MWLNWLMPNTFIPLYSMVSFSTIPYSRVVKRAQTQVPQRQYARSQFSSAERTAAGRNFRLDHLCCPDLGSGRAVCVAVSSVSATLRSHVNDVRWKIKRTSASWRSLADCHLRGLFHCRHLHSSCLACICDQSKREPSRNSAAPWIVRPILSIRY